MDKSNHVLESNDSSSNHKIKLNSSIDININEIASKSS